MREAPRWFRKEFSLIAPKRMEPYWFEKYKKWFIVSMTPYRFLGMTDYDEITGKNFVVEAIIEDENENPVELDRQTLEAIKWMMRASTKGKPFSYYLKCVREIEEPRWIAAKKQFREAKKEAGKDLHHLRTKRTWNLPGIPLPFGSKT